MSIASSVPSATTRIPATLHQLRVFEAVARNGSFTRAAQELHLAQPTVSVQLKDLANALGTPLFEQKGRVVGLTPAGQALLETANTLFETWRRFEMTLSDLRGLKQGTLKISAVTTASYFVPRLLGPFSERYPGIDVRLDVARRSSVVARLAAWSDDLCIMGLPPTDMDIEMHAVLDNPLILIASRRHPLAGKRHIALKDLAGEPFLYREPGSGTRTAVERHMKRHAFHPRVRMELGSNEAIKQAVAGGFGLSVLSLHALSLVPPDGPLVSLDVETFPIRRHWYAVYPRGRRLSPVAAAFLEYMREVCEKHSDVEARLAKWQQPARVGKRRSRT
jgi:DNA-binding transcriptional LysR family regulator